VERVIPPACSSSIGIFIGKGSRSSRSDLRPVAVRAVHTETRRDLHRHHSLGSRLAQYCVLEGSGEFHLVFATATLGASLSSRSRHRRAQATKSPAELGVRDHSACREAGRSIEFLAAGLLPAPIPNHRTLLAASLDGSGLRVLTAGRRRPCARHADTSYPVAPYPPRARDRILQRPRQNTSPHAFRRLTTRPCRDRAPADGTSCPRLANADIRRGPCGRLALADARPHHRRRRPDWNLLRHLSADRFRPVPPYPVIDYFYPCPQRGQLPTVICSDFLPDSWAFLLRKPARSSASW